MRTRLNLLASAVILSLTIIVPESFAKDISGNVSITNHYVWRGLSQTEKLPAIQGGLDWNHDLGFDLGAWGSNVKFAKSVEMDFYGGYTYNFSKHYSVRLGFLHYTYFSEANFYEFNINFDLRGLGVGYAYDPKNKNGYASLGYSHEVFAKISLAGSAGFYHEAPGVGSYWDFKVGASRELCGVTLDLSGTFVTRDVDDPYFVASISKSM